MPVCKQCQETFPNWVVLEGTRRNVSSRKYCLTCSPYGLHNTRDFSRQPLPGAPRVCLICDREHTGKKPTCASCQVNLRRFPRKEQSVAYLGGCCTKCGYSKCIASLAFHHRDPKEKMFGIGSSVAASKPWAELQLELDKCILLCQNCHHELHWEEGSVQRDRMRSRMAARPKRPGP